MAIKPAEGLTWDFKNSDSLVFIDEPAPIFSSLDAAAELSFLSAPVVTGLARPADRILHPLFKSYFPYPLREADGSVNVDASAQGAVPFASQIQQVLGARKIFQNTEDITALQKNSAWLRQAQAKIAMSWDEMGMTPQEKIDLARVAVEIDQTLLPEYQIELTRRKKSGSSIGNDLLRRIEQLNGILDSSSGNSLDQRLADTIFLIRSLQAIKPWAFGDEPKLDSSLWEKEFHSLTARMPQLIEESFLQSPSVFGLQADLKEKVSQDLNKLFTLALQRGDGSALAAWNSENIQAHAQVLLNAHLHLLQAKRAGGDFLLDPYSFNVALQFGSLGLQDRVKEVLDPIVEQANRLASKKDRLFWLWKTMQCYQFSKMSAETNRLLEEIQFSLREEQDPAFKTLDKEISLNLWLNRGNLEQARDFLQSRLQSPEDQALLEKIENGIKDKRLIGGLQILAGALNDYLAFHPYQDSVTQAALESSLPVLLAQTLGLVQSGKKQDFKLAFLQALEGSKFSDVLGSFALETYEGALLWAFLGEFTDSKIKDPHITDHALRLATTFSVRNYFQTVTQLTDFVQHQSQINDDQKVFARDLEENIPSIASLNQSFFTIQELISMSGLMGSLMSSMNPNIKMDAEYFERAGLTIGTLGIARAVGVGAEALWVMKMKDAMVSPLAFRLSTVGVRSVSEGMAFPLAGMGFRSLYSQNNDHWTFENFGKEFGSLLVLFSFLNASKMTLIETGVRNKAAEWAARVGAFTSSSYANEAWQQSLGIYTPESGVNLFARLAHSTVTDRQMMMGTRIVNGLSGGWMNRMENRSEDILRRQFPPFPNNQGETGSLFSQLFGEFSPVTLATADGLDSLDMVYIKKTDKKNEQGPDVPRRNSSPEIRNSTIRPSPNLVGTKSLLDVVPMPALVSDANGKVLYANGLATELFSSIAGGPLGKNLKELLIQMGSDPIFTPRVKGGSSGPYLTLQSKNNPQVEGQQVHFLQDISKLKSLERSQEIGQTVARLNHDANNLWGIMEIFVDHHLPDFEQVYRLVSPGEPKFEPNLEALKDFRSAFQDINDSMIAGRELVRGGQLLKESISLSECLRHAVNAMEKLRKNYGQKVEVSVEENLWVEGNRPFTLNAFINLIKNAYEAMPLGIGVLKITAMRSSDSKEVIIDFVDNGSGISAEDMPRIFDYLFTTKTQGTGIGLNAVKRTVEESLGGKITAESKPGQGARFRIRVPMQEGR